MKRHGTFYGGGIMEGVITLGGRFSGAILQGQLS